MSWERKTTAKRAFGGACPRARSDCAVIPAYGMLTKFIIT